MDIFIVLYHKQQTMTIPDFGLIKELCFMRLWEKFFFEAFPWSFSVLLCLWDGKDFLCISKIQYENSIKNQNNEFLFFNHALSEA